MVFSSDAAVFSGSYFKIKQIQLGYTLPKAISSVAGISNLRVYCSLDDFFTITKYPGADPETASMNSGVYLFVGLALFIYGFLFQ